MYRNDRSRLAPWIEEAYDTLASEIRQREDDNGLETDRAQEILHTDERIEGKEDAQYVLKRLLDRGYLYTVDGKLFVTEPDQ